jgi:D-lactate dehydrogenase
MPPGRYRGAVRLRAPNAVLVDSLERAVPGGVRSRATDRLAMAHDASHYLLTPEAVVAPRDAGELATLLRVSAEQGVPLTFRSGGTSLSGQAVSSGVLVDTRRHFRGIEVLDGGARVRVQPGATVRQVNARLGPYGTKLGPDPASESACTIGGVVANNSSGMACGTERNTYRTLDSLVLVLPSGSVIDTGAPDADARLRALEPTLHEGLLRLQARVRSDPQSVRTIAQQFSLKNTMGYSVNSFVDHDEPVAVLAHLVVGSEGTLAFIAEATFHTVPVLPHVATGLLIFDDLRRANDALPALVAAGLATVELLDAASLRVAQTDPKADDVLRSIAVVDHAALLVEHQELDATGLDDRTAATMGLLARLPLTLPAVLTRDATARAGMWHIRKGLYAAVAGARPSGTTALLEDIAVPVPALAEVCDELLGLFTRHGYEGSVIFGHAKDGNIHFLLNERFAAGAGLDRYVAFTEDMVDLVLAQHGTLKAEHGTGRIMAPFVRRQYGDELYEVMCEVKRLCDPRGLLNPGVLLNDDPMVHVQDLKAAPTVEPEVDRCVECGYCEPVCPSKDLTLTPRQRIVLRRELAAAEASGDAALAATRRDDNAYDGLDTCAVDGMCQTACPVLINTGDLVKRLRAERAGKVEQAVWRQAAKHWRGASGAAARGLDLAAFLPDPIPRGVTALGRRVIDADAMPRWDADLPRGGRPRAGKAAPVAEAVLFPSCTGTMFGPAAGSEGVSVAVSRLCERAGVEVATPPGIASLCCGTPWRSKGLTRGYAEMASLVLPALWEATRHGELPVVCDAASCTEGLVQMVEGDKEARAIRVVDAVPFVAEHVLPRVTVKRTLSSVALHATCSSTRLGTNEALTAVASAIADRVDAPVEWGCCAFAGDRGLLHPELTASATKDEAAAVGRAGSAAHASTNRTCELGMTRATGREYRHLLELVDEATR